VAIVLGSGNEVVQQERPLASWLEIVDCRQRVSISKASNCEISSVFSSGVVGMHNAKLFVSDELFLCCAVLRG
jgi:hypothetical protein